MDADFLLLRRMHQGEEMAIEEFVRKYYPLILRYCRLHLWDDSFAEDVTQEVFARFFRSLPQYRHYGKLPNYLYVIAGNLCRDSCKKLRPISLEEVPEASAEQMPELERKLDVRRALDSLPPELREAAVLILGYLCAGIFANEYRWKADSVYFSAKYGRNKAVWAKIKAGFLLVTALYWGAVLIYSLVGLGVLGFEGWSCPLQVKIWKSFYRMELWQVWVLTVTAGYIGNLFFAFFTMWVSARTRSAVFASTVPFLLVFLPNFLENLNIDALSKLLGLLPDQLLQIYQALRYFNVYDLGIGVFNAMELLLPLWTAATAIPVPMMYRQFRRRLAK